MSYCTKSDGGTKDCEMSKSPDTTSLFEVSLLGFCLGNVLGWASPMEPLLTSPNPPVGTEPMSEDTVTWFCSINFLGTIMGAYIWSCTTDYLGRKPTCFLVTCPLILSWTLILTAEDAGWIFIARLIAGIGTIGVAVNVPPFTAEVAQDDLRGTLGCFLTIFINLGVLFSYAVGAYFKYHILAASCLMFPILSLFLLSWFPESPMFLWKIKKEREAKEALMWYMGGDEKLTEETLLRYKSMMGVEHVKPNLKNLLRAKGTRKAFIIALSLSFATHLSGFYAVLSFSQSIFEASHTSISPAQSAMVTATVLVIFSCFCSVFIDFLGRKTLLIISLTMISISLAILGLYFFVIGLKTWNNVFDWIPLVCLSVHITSFAAGLGPINYVLQGEIFPTEVRGLALSYVGIINGVLGFAVIKVFPILKSNLNLYGCFWFFSAFTFLFTLIFAFYLPETKGKPQSEILTILNGEDNKNKCKVSEY